MLAKAIQPASVTAQAPLSPRLEDHQVSVSNVFRRVTGPRPAPAGHLSHVQSVIKRDFRLLTNPRNVLYSMGTSDLDHPPADLIGLAIDN